MNNEDILHVKFEYDELIRSKKDLLSTQIDLLKIAKAIRNFRFSRTEELNTKLLLHKKSKEFNLILRKLQISLPTLKTPKILQKEKSKKTLTMQKVQTHTQAQHDSTIESELLEIQNRLKNLQ